MLSSYSNTIPATVWEKLSYSNTTPAKLWKSCHIPTLYQPNYEKAVIFQHYASQTMGKAVLFQLYNSQTMGKAVIFQHYNSQTMGKAVIFQHYTSQTMDDIYIHWMAGALGLIGVAPTMCCSWILGNDPCWGGGRHQLSLAEDIGRAALVSDSDGMRGHICMWVASRQSTKGCRIYTGI